MFLEQACQRQGRRDVPVLASLVAAYEQHDRGLAAAGEIYTISWSIIDAQFGYSFPHRPDVARESQRQAVDADLNTRPRTAVAQLAVQRSKTSVCSTSTKLIVSYRRQKVKRGDCRWQVKRGLRGWADSAGHGQLLVGKGRPIVLGGQNLTFGTSCPEATKPGTRADSMDSMLRCQGLNPVCADVGCRGIELGSLGSHSVGSRSRGFAVCGPRCGGHNCSYRVGILGRHGKGFLVCGSPLWEAGHESNDALTLFRG
jgi:hypothetical protein